MSQANGVLDKSFIADRDLNDKQYYVVHYSGTPYSVNLAGTAAATPLGFLQNEPLLGEYAVVRLIGTTKAVAGAALPEQSYLTTDSAGRVVSSSVTDTASVIGLSLEPATAAGDIIEVLIVRDISVTK